MRSLLVLIALASLAACREPTQPPKDPERPDRAVQGSMGPSITPCQWRWRQPVSGNWTDTTKWSPSGVPSSGQVCIDRPGTYIVNVDGGVHTLSDLDLGPSTQLTWRWPTTPAYASAGVLKCHPEGRCTWWHRFRNRWGLCSSSIIS
ncbi:MAG: hypothetical protein IPK85_00500 [Gemmatimonadetes bacterium]|nr:hypothetical protein [Gemmatimonadota bacterium]